MEERNDGEKLDEVLLPGFRFHPTDEELVGFYLKRKIQQRPLSIELIKQIDIYKYDPWDLPKLATTGEKEWYFYCPRDRKYRNSARPNRVTGAGFWKATGTDRPIYSSEGSKCIGLKKSLVFYKGKAAKGIKTDWMMHEFRLPSLTDSAPPKKFMDKSNIPAHESWAICRIFKKTNSNAQRALSHSWVSSLPETITTTNDIQVKGSYNTQIGSENMLLTGKTRSSLHFDYINNNMQYSSPTTTTTFSTFDHIVPFKPINPMPNKPQQLSVSTGDLATNYLFSPFEMPTPAIFSPMLGDIGKTSEQCLDFGGSQEQCSGFSTSVLPHEMQVVNMNNNGEEYAYAKNQNVMQQVDDQWTNSVRSIGFPLSLPMSMGEAWKPSILWDSSSCPSDMPTCVSTKCYT